MIKKNKYGKGWVTQQIISIVSPKEYKKKWNTKNFSSYKKKRTGWVSML